MIDDTSDAADRQRAEETNEFSMAVGERVELESLREPLIPQTLSLEPFVETPINVDVVEQRPFDEDGTIGAVFLLKATDVGMGELTVGFRDETTGNIHSSKILRLTVR